MKNVVVAAILAAGAAAGASADVKIAFPSGFYDGGESSIITLTDLEGELTGFCIDFDFDPASSPGSWASDAGFVLNGTQYGGFDIFLSSASAFGDFWAFDGAGSAAAGHYKDIVAASGTYTFGNSYVFEFGNAWSTSSDVSYKNITVTLKGLTQVPAPGAIALLGLAGLVGRRRRA
jgi:MYXO-CTERM domain-containing protein